MRRFSCILLAALLLSMGSVFAASLQEEKTADLGVDFAAALDRGEAIAINPPPLQGLLGTPLTLVYE